MSKAFTKDDAAPEAPLVRAPPKLAPGEKRYVTREGHARLTRELERLSAQKDPRAGALSALLAALTIAEPDPSETRVRFGAFVELEGEEGDRATYRLVGPDEAGAEPGWISIDSPVARALLGREAGDVVQVQRPKGAREYEILKIRY